MDKTKLRIILAILIFAFGANFSLAQEQDLKSHIIEVGEKKFVSVSRITSEQLNKQFINGIKMMREQRRMLEGFDKKLNSISDSEEKVKLQAQRDELAKRLDSNNRFLIDRFRYSMNRNFIIIVEDSHVYRLSSEEEVAQLKLDYPDQNWDASVRKSGEHIFILVNIVEGEADNRAFQVYAKTIQALMLEKQKATSSISSGEQIEFSKKEKILSRCLEIENEIKEKEALFSENFDVTVESGFVRIVINSKLYVEVTPDEISRLPTEGASILY